ncbi:GtrA family protein [Lacisediminimonas profundi]|uniref:GtrA family protein n=1 Tax=Lacisediminimonas profundi TaxID=2603856 RepID=UPI0013871589|nr:GtrA family protein [Lacisediminimonas profundi]
MPALTAQFLRFCLVGGIGFLVDAGLTLWLQQRWHAAVLESRLLAFVIAATVTWALNRSYTFASTAGAGSWLRYLFLTAAGALINIGLYLAWLTVFGAGSANVLAGVALGSIVAMGFNFTVSRKFVFAVR